MNKLLRLTSILTFICFIFNFIPAFAGSETVIMVSEDFSSYAENETGVTTIGVGSGVDSRVVSDGKNKLFMSRAFGETASFRLPLEGEATGTTVISAKLMLKGGDTTGKFFSMTSGSKKTDLVTFSADRQLKLSDGKILGGIRKDYLERYTLVIDWGKQTIDFYIGTNQAVSDWKVPGLDLMYPNMVEWSVTYNDAEETRFYIDDVIAYQGETLPWKISFPSKGTNSEVKEYTEITEIDTSTVIIADTSFNKSRELSLQPGGGTVTQKTLETGEGVIHLYADSKTKSSTYGDVVNNDIKDYGKHIIDIRFKVNNLTGSAYLGLLDSKNEAEKWRMGYRVRPGGNIVHTDTGTVVGNAPAGEWTRFSIAYNIWGGSATVYVNGKETKTHTVADGFFPRSMRIDLINAEGSVHDTMIDWFRIYSGSALLDDSAFGEESEGVDASAAPSIMDPQDVLKEALADKQILMLTNDYMYIDGKKQKYTSDNLKPVLIDNKPYVSKEAAELVSGKTFEVSGSSWKASGISLKSNVAAKDGINYISFDVFKELGFTSAYDERGLLIVSNGGIYTIDRDHYISNREEFMPADLVFRFMQYDNPSGSKILSDIRRNHPDNSHPRLMYTYDDIEYILDKVAVDENYEKQYYNIITAADSYLDADFSKYATVADASKQDYASGFFNRMEKFSYAFILTGDEAYAKKGIELMKNVALWETNGAKTSNLVIGDISAGFAYGMDTFYNYMNKTAEGQNDYKFLKDNIKRLILSPHVSQYQGTGSSLHWVTLKDNFSGFAGGGLMELLLTLADEPDLEGDCIFLLENVMKSLENMASLYYPDGGYYEGVGYSSYALYHFRSALDELFRVCGTDYGLGTAKGMQQVGDFFSYGQTVNNVFNFHDSKQGFYGYDTRAIFGYIYNDIETMEAGKRQKQLAGRSLELRELYYYDIAVKDKGITPDISGMPLDKYFYGAEAGTFYNTLDSAKPVFVGIHGGRTNIVHDHLDLGEFIFEADGVVWAADLGPDSYSLPGYFGERGYKIYRKRTEGENCVVINPDKYGHDEYYGQELGTRAELVLFESKDKAAMAAYDLTSAYARDADKYTRGYYFGDNRNTLVVQDEISLKNPDSEVYWFMHTAQDINVISNNKAELISKDGKKLIVDVECSATGFSLKKMAAAPLPVSPVVEGQNANDGYSKLAVHIPDASGDVTISVKLSPESTDYTYSGLNVSPISSWTLPDGMRPAIPVVKSVTLNGAEYDMFIPNNREYKIELPFGTVNPPVVGAYSDMGDVQIKQASDIYDATVITLTSDGFAPKEYHLSYTVSTDRPIKITDDIKSVEPVLNPEGTLVVPLGASKKTNPEPNNSADKMLDGDFETRATQQGTNLWFEFDLGAVTDIKGIAMSFYDGDQRRFKYELLYSEDGDNFVRVFDGKSTGTTKDYEYLLIPGRARYIRVIGNGNSSSEWNSITEFRIIK